jgi:uncharacterized protein (TIGR02117 family)
VSAGMRWLRRIGLALAFASSGLFLLASLLRKPADTLLLAKTGDSQIIHVLDHAYHASVVLPVKVILDRARFLELPNIAAALKDFERFEWVEIGWGDEGFYRHVPSLSLKAIPHVLRALLLPGNASVLHVVGFDGDPLHVFNRSDRVQLPISREGLDRMTKALDRSFRVDLQGVPVLLGPGLYGPSAFFAAKEKYHLFNVCNHWLAKLLAEAGLPYAPVEATLSGGLMYDLRRRSVVKLP